jgi:hypothetical protein
VPRITDPQKRRVRTKSLGELEQSLRELGDLYAAEPEQRRTCRSLVIQAKDRMRFAARNPKVDPAKRAEKGEMVQWMLVWLDDPAMFPAWVKIRTVSR